MRLLVLLLSALLLAACSNLVRSRTPWFTTADAEAAAPLRPGLWAVHEKPDCRFDDRKPMERWPDCVTAFVVRPTDQLRLETLSWKESGRTHVEYKWKSEPHVLAAGTPRIDQWECGSPPGKKREAEPAPVAEETVEPDAVAAPPAEVAAQAPQTNETADDGSDDDLVFCYSAVRPDKSDAGGQIVAFTTWAIWCGPFPREGEEHNNVTNQPFPGLTVVEENCTADSVEALRAAAASSEHLAQTPLTSAKARWVRDGYR